MALRSKKGWNDTTVVGIILVVLVAGSVSAALEFEDYFKNCRVGSPNFDACMREALNAVRHYFKTGLPKYKVDPFDPFFAREISTQRGLPSLGFTITLRNVTETGWSASKVTKFVSDLENHKIVYSQSFPEKFLKGHYEFNAALLNQKLTNKGKFTLGLYDLTQTTTITKEPGAKMKVRVDVESIGDLKLHITNLLYGREMLEKFLDRIINGAWQPGFTITRPIINDLVSVAFTDIFGKSFEEFPFERIFKHQQTNSSTSIGRRYKINNNN